MKHYTEHLIKSGSLVKQALSVLNELSIDAVLFVIDANERSLFILFDGAGYNKICRSACLVIEDWRPLQH